MKFSTILTQLVATAASIASTVAAPVGEEMSSLKVVLDYHIKEQPNVGAKDVATFYNGEEISLSYTITNNEEKPLSIVGVGGEFVDPNTEIVKTNLTSVAVEPVTLESGKSHNVVQRISLNLIPDNYALSPSVYAVIDEQFKLLKARSQLCVVDELPLSIFDPRLLFLEVILLATLGGIVYAVYSMWGKQYFEKETIRGKPKKAASPTATSTGAAVDQSWIPESHLKKKKTRKAY